MNLERLNDEDNPEYQHVGTGSKDNQVLSKRRR